MIFILLLLFNNYNYRYIDSKLNRLIIFNQIFYLYINLNLYFLFLSFINKFLFY